MHHELANDAKEEHWLEEDPGALASVSGVTWTRGGVDTALPAQPKVVAVGAAPADERTMRELQEQCVPLPAVVKYARTSAEVREAESRGRAGRGIGHSTVRDLPLLVVARPPEDALQILPREEVVPPRERTRASSWLVLVLLLFGVTAIAIGIAYELVRTT